jgi:hypothetical protein
MSRLITLCAKYSLIACILVLVACMLACGDSPNGTDSDEFAIALTVVDIDGNPIEGAQVGAMPAIPQWVFPEVIFPEDPSSGRGDRPSVNFRVLILGSQSVKILCLDVAGEIVRVLGPTPLETGAHILSWDGRDDNGDLVATGYYCAELHLFNDSEEWEAMGAKGMLLLDPWSPLGSLGSTTSSGRLTITDRKIVPGFWSPSDIEVTWDSPTIQGTFSVTTETWLYCQDVLGRTGWGVLDAVDGPQNLRVTILLEPGVLFPGGNQSHEITRLPFIQNPIATLYPPYPNPFN